MKQLQFGKILIYLLLIVGAITMVFPFFWMFISSLKTAAEVNTTPPTLWPSILTFDNFIYAFETAPFARYFLNSVIVAFFNVVLTGITTILAAFAFSRLKFPGKEVLFSLLLSLMMIPFEMLIITNYTTIADLGLIDTLSAMIIPFTSSIFYTYILRNFFQSIPDSLYHSARIDGASNWKYLWKIMVPIAKPAIITILLLNAISSWNAFMWPMLVTNTTNNRTLPFGLYAFISESGVRYEVLMAASTIVILPMVILFLFMRKSIVSSVAQGGTKG
ncbi:ABC transporter permease [Oceanobacillus arenosus]|uniref:ABC transporter permease n=1 Tax=Oceanobacillus arenosus TaxID=1229153 RepID=A0A3D8PQC0_9BACI|nr:carbohydrate ABC transporter permease [Oceanobacillus arenosus]RDW18346.1 ABC transporter permease [Oceanobacillus arenosus]